MNIKYTYKEVKNIFQKEHWTLLSKEYKRNIFPLEVLCQNGHKLKTTLNNFLRGHRCMECCGRRYLNIDIIRKEFEKDGYNLLTTKYINAWQILDYICDKGHQRKIAYYSFHLGRRCAVCSNKAKYTFVYVKEEFKKRGWKLLSKKYVRSGATLKVECPKGHITNTVRFNTFLKGTGCSKCRNINNSGENNFNWNSSLTNYERLNGRKHNKNVIWIKEVLKRDNYTCQCCGEKGNGHNLNTHHLEGFHWCKELRVEINNGVTLCNACHTKFHKEFWSRWNTTEQFVKFLRGGYNASIKT